MTIHLHLYLNKQYTYFGAEGSLYDACSISTVLHSSHNINVHHHTYRALGNLKNS